MNDEHNPERLADHVVGLLDEDERRFIEEHLAECQRCQAEVAELHALERSLEKVPPAALLEGPPPGSDLMLQRMLHKIREDRLPAPTRKDPWRPGDPP